MAATAPLLRQDDHESYTLDIDAITRSISSS